MLNLVKLREIIDTALPTFPSIEQASMALVVGLPGSGKSTITNYLLGYAIEKNEEGLAESVESNPPAKMGDSAEAVTLMPTIYKGNDGLSYCDCPGFLNSSGDEFSVCASITLETMVKSAKKISAILVIIDFNTIQTQRGEGLKILSHILGRFLKNPEVISESILFLINKASLEETTKKRLSDKINNLIEYEEKKLNKIKLKFERVKSAGEKILEEDFNQLHQIQQMLSVMRLMQSHFDDNVIFINVFDQGQNRLKIVQRIKQIPDIHSELFDFNQYDSARLQFMQAMSHIMLEAVTASSTREALYLQIENLQNNEKETSEKINSYQQSIKMLYEEILSAIQNPIAVAEQQAILKKNLLLQQVLNASQQNLLDEQNHLQAELEHLAEATPISYWRDAVDSSAFMLSDSMLLLAKKYGVDWLLQLDESLYKQIDEGKRFHYQGIPFVKAELQHTGGIFLDEYSCPEQGIYSVLYKGSLFEKAAASVTIFVKKCDLPENKNKIEILRSKLNQNNKKQQAIEAKLADLQIEQKISENFYAELKAGNQAGFYECKKQLEQLVSLLQADINQIREQYKLAEGKLEEIKNFISKRKNLFEAVGKTITVLAEDIIPLKKEFLTSMQALFPSVNPLFEIRSIVPEVKQEKVQVVEKAWYFDEQSKPKLPEVNNYALIPASQKDTEKVINHYQHHPMPGYDIRSVKIIYNPKMNRAFSLNIELLQQRANNPAFKPKWSIESKTEEERLWRGEVGALCEKLAAPYQDFEHPAVKILPLWHGTKPEILDSLFKTGYVNLASTDSGFFGKGIYSAHEAEYSYRVYSRGALILNWVATFSAYPVIDGDMPKLTEKGNYQNYDAHFIPVAPANPTNPYEVNYFPCKPNQKHQYTEVVVFEKSQCLPRYLVELQPNLPKEPGINSYKHGENPYLLMPKKLEEDHKPEKKQIDKSLTGTPGMKFT